MSIKRNWLLISVVALPSTLFLWISNIILSSLVSVQSISIIRWFSSIYIPIIFVYWGLKRNSLSVSGAIAGYVVGFVITLSSFAFLACLIVFFVSSSKATKFRSHLKKKFEENFVEGGKRHWVQVLANGIAASLIAVMYINDCGCKELPFDLVNRYKCSFHTIAFLGAFACSNGDTWSSELGPVLAWGEPVLLITSFSSVPKGTNGGVSLAGLFASILGGTCVGFFFFVSLHLYVPSHIMRLAPSQVSVILLGGIGGLVGSLIDSFLGATLQYSGLNEDKIVVEHPGAGVRHISGRNILNNHSVNLLSTILTAILLPFIALYIY